MLQDIEPYQFNNEFKISAPSDDDYVLVVSDNFVLLNNQAEELEIPIFSQISSLICTNDLIYLFSISEKAVYFCMDKITETDNLHYKEINSLREVLPHWILFIVATAEHLTKWYTENRYCGKCANAMSHSKTERALCCDSCGIIKYPNINPAVIVGIVHKDKLLMTKYADRPYKKLALVAGFMEIGETFETTVKREVMEEVGLKIKKNQVF